MAAVAKTLQIQEGEGQLAGLSEDSALFEQRYGMNSADFFARYQAGQMGDAAYLPYTEDEPKDHFLLTAIMPPAAAMPSDRDLTNRDLPDILLVYHRLAPAPFGV